MMEQKYSAQYLRKRKFLLVLPLLVLPFITLAFWSLGGGTRPTDGSTILFEEGLNATVPDARFRKEKPLDKMQAYAIADRDSNRLEKMMKQDPYYRAYTNQDKKGAASGQKEKWQVFSDKGRVGPGKEQELMEQLESLQRALASEEPAQQKTMIPASPVEPAADKMLAMIDKLNAEEKQGDPQMAQLNQMLDKIMTIQQRETGSALVPDNLEVRDSVQAITTEPDVVDTELLAVRDTRFWGLEEDIEAAEVSGGIRAVIAEEQTLVNSAILKMRLVDDVHLGKTTIKSGEYVYGKVSLNNERLQVEIPTVRTETGIVAVKWRIYDMDGLEGIYVPGSIDKDVIQQSGGNGLQSVDLLGSINPSLPMQAASLGIQTAKNLISKKAKLVKLYIKAGHQVLIRDMASK